MMFNDHPEKFFPYMQANITVFPKGRLNDPDNFIEVPTIYGPVDAIIDKEMGYLRTNIVKEFVAKVPGQMEDFESGTPKPRRYRNRRLGDFLKELDLTEGKSTGITTVRAKLKSNGSPAAIYEFDEERTYFSATVKIHPDFPRNSDSQNVPYDVPHEHPRLAAILDMISADKTITREEIAKELNVSKKTIGRDLRLLSEIVHYVGSGDKGHWELVK